MAEYGIPYKGSKQAIADEIIKIFPKADNFYDLFGGGFSITHAMLLRRSKHYKNFYFNEIKSDLIDLIKRAIAGEFNYTVFKPKFISREEFLANLNDPYIRVVWSFGNNQKDYLFSKEIEPYKRSMHNAIVFNEFDGLAKKVFKHDGFREGYSIPQRRLFLRARIEYYRTHGIPDFLLPYLNEKERSKLDEIDHLQRLEQLERLQQLQQLEHLQQLQRLEQLQQLERLEHLQQLEQLGQLEQLEFSSESYEKIPIKENSIIYCDPPYKGTGDYGNSFNTEKFLDWADTQTKPVFISEYNISDKRFKLIKTINKYARMNNSGDTKKVMSERIYVNKAGQ